MKRAITTVLVIGLACGCGKSKSGTGTQPVQPATAKILTHIPADSPFALVTAEPMPRELTDWIGQAMAPLTARLQQEMTELRAKTDEPVARAILAELDGKLSRAGLESMGFTLEPRLAIYMIGPSLAMRVEVADGARVSALIERIEQNSGQALPKATLDDVTYRQWVDGDGAIVAAVIGNELVVGLMHQNARNLVLPVLFGKAAPQQSFADTGVLRQYSDKYELVGFSMGYVDSHAIVRMLTGKASALTQQIMTASEVPLPDFSPACQAEFTQLADAAPRMVFGYRDLSPKLLRGVAALELRPDLAAELSGLRSPALDLSRLGAGKPMFAMGVNLDVGKAISWAKGKVSQMAATPYRCEHFAELNEGIAEVQRDMDSPLPPFVSGFKGLAVSVADFQMTGFMPTGSGYVTVAMDDVMGALDTLKGQIPQLAMLNIRPDGKPMSLPVGMPGLEKVDVIATDTRISVAAGADMAANANAMMAAQATGDGPTMVFAYDYARLMQAMQQNNSDPDAALLMNTVASFFGFVAAEVQFTNNGVLVTSSMQPR